MVTFLRKVTPNIALTLLAVLLCTGCAGNGYVLNRDNATEQEKKRDYRDCKQDSLHAVEGLCSGLKEWSLTKCKESNDRNFDVLLNDCLKARGYTVTREQSK